MTSGKGFVGVARTEALGVVNAERKRRAKLAAAERRAQSGSGRFTPPAKRTRRRGGR